MELNELVEKTEQWFIDRGIDKAEPSKQMLKLYEEYGELCGGIMQDDRCVVEDSIGDMMVVITGLSMQIGVKNPVTNSPNGEYRPEQLVMEMNEFIGMLSASIAKDKPLEHKEDFLSMVMITLTRLAETMSVSQCKCLELAYNEIKDRKGKLINGVFIKEEDLHED